MTKKFDSIQFCFSKGLGAPVGSMIVGSRDFIERCRVIRKMLGGGMRQVGVLAAAALVALEEGPKRLHIDHENARVVGEGLAQIPGIGIQPEKVQTNIVLYDVGETGLSSTQFLKRLARAQSARWSGGRAPSAHGDSPGRRSSGYRRRLCELSAKSSAPAFDFDELSSRPALSFAWFPVSSLAHPLRRSGQWGRWQSRLGEFFDPVRS